MTSRATRSATTPRTGRKSKGNRVPLLSRVPEDLGDLVIAAQEKSGLTLNDYILVVLAEKHGYTIPDHLRPAGDNSVQEAFAMQTAS